MRIGLINQLHGRPGDNPPTWDGITERVRAAEEAGFDIFVFEDALLYRGEHETHGVWESMTMAAALAATTTHIELGQSVVNSPYRSPALVASMATTLDEISAGRYVLGIGAGNTPDSDYHAFGFPSDHRYSRFAEAIEIIYALLKEGRTDFEGEFYSVTDSELVLRGPSPNGPRINVAAGGEQMLALAARFGDEWNWWSWDETHDELSARLTPILSSLDAACEAFDREPATLRRTFDLYAVVAPGMTASHGLENPLEGSADEIAEKLLAFGELGFSEVRCDVWPKTPAGIAAMRPVLDLVHAG